MRFLAALFLCLAVTPVMAKPSRLADQFRGDRWLIAQAGTTAADVNHIMRCPAPLGRDCRVPGKAKKKLHRHGRAKVAARSGAVIVPVPRVRPELDEDQAAAYRVIAELLAGGKVYVKPLPVTPRKPMNILTGFAREIGKALPGQPRGRSLAGVVAPLAAKANELVDRCGSRVISAVRHTYVAGTRRISLHASGRAVDMAGNPSCMYALLRKWPGGVSTDYSDPRIRHIHISYAPPSRGQRGREWGVRFAHHHVGRRTRYARHIQRHRHYASAR